MNLKTAREIADNVQSVPPEVLALTIRYLCDIVEVQGETQKGQGRRYHNLEKARNGWIRKCVRLAKVYQALKKYCNPHPPTESGERWGAVMDAMREYQAGNFWDPTEETLAELTERASA